MIRSMSLIVGGIAGLWLAGAASAQEVVVACSSQEALQAHIDSNGASIPEECRQITIREGGGGVCSFDLGAGGGEDGLMSALAGAAVPTEWWALCGQLEEAAE